MAPSIVFQRALSFKPWHLFSVRSTKKKGVDTVSNPVVSESSSPDVATKTLLPPQCMPKSILSVTASTTFVSYSTRIHRATFSVLEHSLIYSTRGSHLSKSSEGHARLLTMLSTSLETVLCKKRTKIPN